MMKTYRSKPTENTVESAVLKFMKEHGWRATRNHVGVFKTAYGGTISIGTKGFPDWTFTRRFPRHGCANLMHVEAKAPGKRPAPKQVEVMASLNYLGELAVWCDSLESFRTVYEQYFPAE